MKRLSVHLKRSVLLTLAALGANSALASVYHFGTQSVSAQSTANASAAEASDPSTLFYNPAGLSKLEGTQATINLNIVTPRVKYSDGRAFYPDGTEVNYGPDNHTPAERSGKITKSVQFVPHLYASHQINDQFSVGLGTYVPFGSGTEYDHNSVLRYNLNELGLQTMAIQPTVAFKLNDQHSFAVGAVAQHTTAELRQYANYGASLKTGLDAQIAPAAAMGVTAANVGSLLANATAGVNQLNAAISATEAAGGDASALRTQLATVSQQQAQLARAQAAYKAQANATAHNSNGNGYGDGYAKVKGDDWGFGYNLAWLWDINDRARVGVNYRSKVDHTLKGDAEWQLVGPAFSDPLLGGTFAHSIRDRGYAEKESASVKITTPESLSLHGMFAVNPQWNLYGDVTWTRHSRFNQANLMWGNVKTVGRGAARGDLDGNPANGDQSNVTVLTPNWRNTYKVSLGASYQMSEPLQLRFGVAYDQSPVKNANYRMSTMPDNDRIWLSLGAKYDINKQHSINAAFSHIFIKKASANVNGYCGGDSAGEVACVSSKTHGSANYKSSANILGMQYTYKF